MQQLDTLAGGIVDLRGKSRDVAAGPGQTFSQSVGDWIAAHRNDNRDRRRDPFYGKNLRVTRRYDDINFEADELLGNFSGASENTFCRTIFYVDVPALDPPQVAETLHEGYPAGPLGNRRARAQ
jgi:hypothetical protein